MFLYGFFLKFIAIFQVICLSVNQNQIKSTMCSYKPFLQEVTTPWEYLQPYDNILVLNSCTVNFVKNPAILIFNIQLMWQIHGSVRALAFFWGNYISKIYKSAKLRLRPLEANNAVKKIIGMPIHQWWKPKTYLRQHTTVLYSCK